MKEYIEELNLKQPFFTGLILVQNTRLVLMNIEYVKFLWHYQLELRKQFQKKNETIHWKLMNDSWKKKKEHETFSKLQLAVPKYSSHFEIVSPQE